MRVRFQRLAVPLLGAESFSSQTILLHLGKSTDVIHVLTAQEQDKVRILCRHGLIAYTPAVEQPPVTPGVVWRTPPGFGY
jgi:hypothetical protein